MAITNETKYITFVSWMVNNCGLEVKQSSNVINGYIIRLQKHVDKATDS